MAKNFDPLSFRSLVAAFLVSTVSGLLVVYLSKEDRPADLPTVNALIEDNKTGNSNRPDKVAIFQDLIKASMTDIYPNGFSWFIAPTPLDLLSEHPEPTESQREDLIRPPSELAERANSGTGVYSGIRTKVRIEETQNKLFYLAPAYVQIRGAKPYRLKNMVITSIDFSIRQRGYEDNQVAYDALRRYIAKIRGVGYKRSCVDQYYDISEVVWLLNRNHTALVVKRFINRTVEHSASTSYGIIQSDEPLTIDRKEQSRIDNGEQSRCAGGATSHHGSTII